MGNNSSKQQKHVIYVIGENIGELCLGHQIAVKEPTVLNKPNFSNIHCGNRFSIYGDDNQNYWFVGCGPFGNPVLSPKKINYFKRKKIKIQKICTNACGSHLFFITDSNEAYGCGYNSVYQLGIGHNKFVKQPQRIDSLQNVIDIQSANCYSIALCGINYNKIIIGWIRINQQNKIPNDIIRLIQKFHGLVQLNKVYSTYQIESDGTDFYNHSILQHADKTWKEIEIFNDKQIIKIRTGEYHSLFLQSDGTLWVSGAELYGIKYYDRNEYISAKPFQIEYFKKNKIKIKDIACGLHHNLAIDVDGTQHSYALTEDGKHFMWGYNSENQCVVWRNTSPECDTPKEIQHEPINNRLIKSVHLGDNNTTIIVEKRLPI
eukprot:535067_1